MNMSLHILALVAAIFATAIGAMWLVAMMVSDFWPEDEQ